MVNATLAKFANIGQRVVIKDDEIRIEAGLDLALFRGLEIRRLVGWHRR